MPTKLMKNKLCQGCVVFNVIADLNYVCLEHSIKVSWLSPLNSEGGAVHSDNSQVANWTRLCE